MKHNQFEITGPLEGQKYAQVIEQQHPTRVTDELLFELSTSNTVSNNGKICPFSFLVPRKTA
jgi:hypothetical protein